MASRFWSRAASTNCLNMPTALFFLLGPAQDRSIRWASASGGEVIAGGSLPDAEALGEVASYGASAATVIALLPGEQVACRRMPAAPKGGTKLKAAARYLMEDELGEATEDLKVGAAASRDVAVAYAARADIVDGWLAAFAAAGIDVDILSADYLALTSSTHEASIVIDGDRAIAAFAGVGLALEADLFSELAPDLFAQAPSVFHIVGEESLIRNLPSNSAVDWLGPADEAGVLREFARALGAGAPPNFLESRFIRKKAFLAAAGPWRRTAALAACLAGVAFLSFLIEGARNSRIAARYIEGAKSLHQQAHPAAASEDPVAFARQRLAASGPQASFLTLSSRVATALEQQTEVEVDRIRYDAARGEFVFTVRSVSDAAVESFKAELASIGVAAQDSGGFRKTGDFWSGDLSARLQ
jgi:type II secretion system protein L